MVSVMIAPGEIPVKLNSRLLREEIAATLSVDISLVELQACLSEIRVTKGDSLGTVEEVIPPYILIGVPDGTDENVIKNIVIAHTPAQNDAEEVAVANVAAFKAQLTALANDPDMIALIKAAAAS